MTDITRVMQIDAAGECFAHQRLHMLSDIGRCRMFATGSCHFDKLVGIGPIEHRPSASLHAGQMPPQFVGDQMAQCRKLRWIVNGANALAGRLELVVAIVHCMDEETV